MGMMNTHTEGWTNQGSKLGAPAATKKRVIPKQTAKNEEIDELDDLMGFNGGSSEQSQQKSGGQESQMRDTLGFLKKSEDEKKKREEEKKSALIKKDAAYKLITEVNHNLGGYEPERVYPYTMGSVPVSIRNQLKTVMKYENIS
jgi:hypothetical protein